MLHRSRRSRQTKVETPLFRFVVNLLLLRNLTAGNLLGILLYNESEQVVQQIEFELMEFVPSGSYVVTCDRNNPLTIRPLNYKI